MTGEDLRTARSAFHWTQVEAAERLGVTQAYLSMVERGNRPVSDDLAAVVLHVYALPPTARPFGAPRAPLRGDGFSKALGELGYPGFAYLRGRVALNPAELLLLAINEEELDARVTEGLAWVPFRFTDLNWDWLTVEAKLRDRQNRLAYVTELASAVARLRGDVELAETLHWRVITLERSRLANEDTLCKASLSPPERKWLRKHRPPAAVHWRLLTDLKAEDLHHVY